MIQVEGTFGGGAKLNGIKSDYLATADIGKGDFVQLTTWGVENVALQEALSWTQKYLLIGSAAVAVLSSTQIMVIWNDHGADETSDSSTSNTYVQAITYINGSWMAGTAVLLRTKKVSYPAVSIERWTDNRAVAAIGGGDTYGNDYSTLWVLDVSDSGEITVVYTQDEVRFCDTGYNNAVFFRMNDTQMISLANSYYDEVDKVYARLIENKNGAIVVSETHTILSGDDAATIKGNCKINDAAFMFCYGTDKLCIVTWSGSVFSPKKISTTINQYSSLIQWEDNKVLVVSNGKESPYFFTYDAATGTLTKGANILADAPAYYSRNAVRISDDKVIALALSSSAFASTNSSYLKGFTITDITKGTSVVVGTDVFSALLSGYDKFVCADKGWFAIINSNTQLLVAPCVTEITAAPYFTRLDGVATKGATAGGMAEVVTPE